MVKNRITLSQAIEGYTLAAHARRLSRNTLNDYDNAFRKLESFLSTDPPVDTITPVHVRTFLDSQSHLSAKTLLNHHIALSALWTWAVDEGIVGRQIVRQVKPPKPERRVVQPYSEADVRAMLAACDRSRTYARTGKRISDHSRPTALRDRAIITLLVDTGLRASELCGLTIPDIDFRNHQIVVLGKGAKERIVHISPRTAQHVWRYLATRSDQERKQGPCFTTAAGGPIERNNLRHTLQQIGQRAGVQNVTVHRFRHTFAINFLRNGGNVFALRRALGHETLEMVDRYLQIAQADLQTAHREASPVANWRL